MTLMDYTRMPSMLGARQIEVSCFLILRMSCFMRAMVRKFGRKTTSWLTSRQSMQGHRLRPTLITPRPRSVFQRERLLEMSLMPVSESGLYVGIRSYPYNIPEPTCDPTTNAMPLDAPFQSYTLLEKQRELSPFTNPTVFCITTSPSASASL